MKNSLLTLVLLLCLQALAQACDISVTIEPSSRKEVYQPGDEVVVLVQVRHTHRVCRLPMEETTYEPEGFVILAASDWKESAPGTWNRKMKLKVKGTATGDLVFSVRRKCTRDDNTGTVHLAGIPLKKSPAR